MVICLETYRLDGLVFVGPCLAMASTSFGDAPRVRYSFTVRILSLETTRTTRKSAEKLLTDTVPLNH